MFEDKELGIGIKELKCPICGKDFTVYFYKNWAYKIKLDGWKQPVCSWGCLRKYNRDRYGDPNGKRKKEGYYG